MTKTFKRLLAGMLAVCMIFSLMPTVAHAADAAEITSLTQITDPSGNYKIVADISETLSAPVVEQFYGTLDGDGHTVTFALEGSGAWFGLFGGTGWGASIKNLKLANCVVTNTAGDNSYTGLLGGYCYGPQVTNVTAVNCTVTGNERVGGLMGQNDYGTVSQCAMISGTVTCLGSTNQDYVGGLVGYNAGTIEKCYNMASVINSDTVKSGNLNYVGGIAGHNGSTVQNCYNGGTVKDGDAMVSSGACGIGGITGSGSAYYCYNMGAVQSETASGVYAVSPSASFCFALENCGGDASGATVVTAEELKTLAPSIGTDCWLTGDASHPYPVLDWQTDAYDLNSNMPYTVKYWKQSDSENAVDGYEYAQNDDQTFRGVVGEEPSFTPRTYTGFVLNAEKSATDAKVAEGLVVNLYYDLGYWNLSYDFGGETAINEGEYTPAGLVAYGTKLVMPQTAVGYKTTWGYVNEWGYTATVNEYMTMPANDLALSIDSKMPEVYPITWNANGGKFVSSYYGYDENYDWVQITEYVDTMDWNQSAYSTCGAGYMQRLGDYLGFGYDADGNWVGTWGGENTRELPVVDQTPAGMVFGGWVMGTSEQDPDASDGDLIVTLDPSKVYTADSVIDYVPEDGKLTFYAYWVEPESVSVTITAQALNGFLVAPGTYEVSAALAESYGYTDTDKGVSTLDVLVRAHELVLGDAFTPDTAYSFLAVNSYGFINTIFGIETGNCGFAVNGAMPNDGVETSDGYNGLAVGDATVADGDKVEFFVYQDEAALDNYAWFMQNGAFTDSITADEGTSVELGVKGYCYGYNSYLYKDFSEVLEHGSWLEDVQLALVDKTTGSLTDLAGAVTNEEGKTTFTAPAEGEYFLTGYVSDADVEDGAIPVILPLATLTVAHVHTPETVGVVEATCVADGYTGDVVCSKCGETLEAGETIPALGHAWGEWTDNGDGTRTRACSRCDATETGNAVTTKTVTLRTEVNNNTQFYTAAAEISSDLSDKYGYVDFVEGPSMLDAFIYAELLIDLNIYPNNDSWIYADFENGSFSADATGTVTKFASQPNVGFAINESLCTAAAGTIALEDDMDIIIFGRNDFSVYYLGVKGPDGNYGKTLYTETLIPTNLTVMGVAAFATDGTVADAESAVPMENVGFVPYALQTKWKNPVITGSFEDKVAVTNKTGVAAITYTQPGTYQYVVTGYYDNLIMNTVTVVVSEHVHAPELTSGTPATCTTAGCEDYYLCACGKLFSDAEGKTEIAAPVEIPALGHDWDDGVVTTPATEDAEGVMTFTCTRCGETYTEVIPAIECPSAPFTDVNPDKWYHAAVDFVVANGLMNGMSETTFAPNGTLTRAQMAQILYNMAGKPEVTAENPFSDVKEGKWFYAPVVWAASEGIVTGATATTFTPNGLLTREQMVVMLYRAYADGATAETDHLSEFPDGSKVGSYAKTAMNWAIENGIINGMGGLLAPKNNMTRAQVATVFMNYMTAE